MALYLVDFIKIKTVQGKTLGNDHAGFHEYMCKIGREKLFMNKIERSNHA